MKPVLTSIVTKSIFVTSLVLITAIGYTQNLQLNITSAIRTIYLTEYVGTLHSKQTAVPVYDFINNNITAPVTPEIMVLYVSPDPCVGDFKIQVSASLKDNISVKVFSTTGKLLRRIAIKRNEAIFFGNDLNPGNYIMEIKQGNIRRIQKLVKYK